jgi:protein ImuB
MKVPSYDDLAPSIPDISPGDVFASVGRLLPRAGPVGVWKHQRRSGATPGAPAGCHSTGAELYAALHGMPIETLTAIARDFSPRIERQGTSDVVLDVSGLGRLLGDASAIGVELARAGAARVAVVSSQIGARLLARARPGVTVSGDDLEETLRAVRLTVLQHLIEDAAASACGARAPSRAPRGASPFDTLQRWGLNTLGELAALPAAELSARLGQRGLALQQLARGIDPRPLVPDSGVVRFIQSMELEWPIESLEPLSFVFSRLLEPLSAALERADRGAAAVRLDLRLTDRTTHLRVLQLPAAMRDARVLRTLLLLDLESHPPAAAVDIVTIEADPAPARIIQYSLLERALPSTETLATLNARLAALIGADRCGAPELLDTHRPDAFEMRTFAAPGVTPSPSIAAAPCSGMPVVGSPVMRRFRPPVAIRVTVEHGRPVRIAIDRQGMPGGRITQAAGPWRSSGAWWQRATWDRDEWDVTCSDGTACRIFRERHGGMWFLEGVFD